MVVDTLRSYHFGPALMVLGGMAPFWVRWYRCSPGAKPLPFPSFMGSAIWQTRTEWDDGQLGMSIHTPGPPDERKGPSPYLWAPTRYPAPPGQHWHGEPQWFQTGLPAEVYEAARRLPPRTDRCGEPLIEGDGGSCCCGDGDMRQETPAVVRGVGDLVLDGLSSMPISILITDKATISPMLPVTGSLFLPDATSMLLTLPAGSVIQGLTGGIHGRLITLEMVGGVPFRVTHDDSSVPAAQRIVCLNAQDTHYWQGNSRWYQYDGFATRWRELSAVPLISQPGDLLTADPTGPKVLPVSSTPQQVLTAQPSAADKLGWGDGAGGTGGAGDLNYPKQRLATTEIGDRWYLSTGHIPSQGSPVMSSADTIYLQPFLNPSGYHIESIKIYLDAVGSIPDACLLGIYEEAGSGDLLPGPLKAFTSVLTLAGGPDVVGTLNYRPTPGKMYWLAFIWRNVTNTVQFNAYLEPPVIWMPFLGSPGDLDHGPPSWWYRVVSYTWDGTLPNPCPRPTTDGRMFTSGPRIGVRFGNP